MIYEYLLTYDFEFRLAMQKRVAGLVKHKNFVFLSRVILILTEKLVIEKIQLEVSM